MNCNCSKSFAEWALQRWKEEVRDRPLVNMHRRTLDDSWRQVYRFATDGQEIPFPTHDELLREDLYDQKYEI